VSYPSACVCAGAIVRRATMCAFCDKSRELDAAELVIHSRFETESTDFTYPPPSTRWVREMTNTEPRRFPSRSNLLWTSSFSSRLEIVVFLRAIPSFLLFSHRWWIAPLRFVAHRCTQEFKSRSANNSSLSLIDYKIHLE